MKELNYEDLNRQFREYCEVDKENRAVMAIIVDGNSQGMVIGGSEEIIAAGLAMTMLRVDGLAATFEKAVAVYHVNKDKYRNAEAES